MAVAALTGKQERRRTALKMASTVLYGSASVVFSGWFITEWSWPTITTVSVLVGAGCALFGLMPEDNSHRERLDQEAEHEAPIEGEDADSSEGFLARVGDILFSAAIVGVIGVAMLLFTFLLPIVIVSAIAINEGASLLAFSAALGATLAVAFVFEFGVSYPLDKRWGLGVFV